MPKTIGRYEILEEVGRGSMGVVYRARDPRIGLNHPNIVTIYDVGEKGAGGDAYIAMEFVTGTNLHELLAGGGRLPLMQVADVVEKLAQALDYAHENGVVHRDIKPANILLTESGQPKILDFGIARLAAGGLTRPGKFFGTPNYMSPEQVVGAEIDGRTDQFSLGIILYQLLTGEKPFVGDSVTAISYQVVNVDPPPPSKLNPALRPPFDRIIRKTLAKNASDRYVRCQDLAADLKSAVTEWRESSEQSTPPTLVSRDEARGDSAEPVAAGVRGITLLAPRLSRLFTSGGTPLGIGWIAFLVCLVLLASAPFLLYRSPGGRATGSQPLGLLTAPASAGSQGTAPGAALAGPGAIAGPSIVDPEQAARLRLTLLHRFPSGRIEVRLDGAPLLGERLKGGSGKIRFVRTLPVAPGSHRVEVRVVSGHNFDDVEGIQGDFRSKELKNLQVTVSTIGKRLKMRFETPEAETSHR